MIDPPHSTEEILDCLEELARVCDAAIVAGDWKVDGACEPECVLAHAFCILADNGRMLLSAGTDSEVFL